MQRKMKFSTMELETPMKLGMIVPIPLAFSTVTIDPARATEPVTIQAFRTGKWDHMLYGKVEMTPFVFHDIIQNFKANAFGQDLSINYEHGLDRAKGLQAAGWVKDMQSTGNAMMWSVQFTQDALQEIQDGKWRYFSPEFYKEYTDPETKKVYHHIAAGGALTNTPYFKDMMPLNFSDFFQERDLKLYFSDNANAGNGWPTSEPGSLAPDLSKLEPDIAALEGWRVDTPPYPEPIPNNGQPYNFNGREDSLVNREQMLLFAASIGLTVESTWTDEQLTEKIKAHGAQLFTELQPLRDAAAAIEQRQTFAQQYPAEFARMQALEATNRQTAAQAFSQNFARFVEKDEEGKDVESKFGFSALTLDKIKEMHIAIADGSATLEQFSALLETVGNKGILEFGARGSNLDVEGDEGGIEPTARTVNNVRAMFSGRVAKYKAENPDKTLEEAVTEMAKAHPKEFEAYQTPLVAQATS